MFLKNGWEVSIEMISPEIAKDWLRRNVSNRRQRPGTIKKYAITMASGKWMLTPVGNSAYVKEVYRGLCLGDVANLPPIAQSIIGAVASGRLGGTGSVAQYDFLNRAWKVFDESKRNASKVVVDRGISGNIEIASLIKPAGWSA